HSDSLLKVSNNGLAEPARRPCTVRRTPPYFNTASPPNDKVTCQGRLQHLHAGRNQNGDPGRCRAGFGQPPFLPSGPPPARHSPPEAPHYRSAEAPPNRNDKAEEDRPLDQQIQYAGHDPEDAPDRRAKPRESETAFPTTDRPRWAR